MLEYLHLLTFCAWAPLALLAASQRRRPAARALWALSAVTLIAWIGNLYLEFVWSRRVVAPIRVDLLFTVPLATVLFAAIGAWGLRRRGATAKIAAVLLLLFSLPTLAVFLQGMWQASRDSARLDDRAGLIFEAQFRNPATFARFFGDADSASEPRAGHFQAMTARGYVSRAIVNSRGHAWLLIRCGNSIDCVAWEAELPRTAAPATIAAHGAGGGSVNIEVFEWSHDRLTLGLQSSPADVLVRTPVPYRELHAGAGAVTYHGAYSQMRVNGEAIELVQLWLWHSGDRWLAYYVRQNMRCGSTNDFVHPSPYAGKPTADAILFDAAEDTSIEAFQIRLAGDAQVRGQITYGGAPLEALALDHRAVVESPLFDTAPLADFAATERWLKTISMGYFLSWRAECPASPSAR